MIADETSAAIGILTAEHDVCRRQLQEASAALAVGASAPARPVFDEAWQLLTFLETELETHIAKEEGPLFPRLKAALPLDDRLIDEMVAEHDLIRIKRDDVRAALLNVLDDHDHLRSERDGLRAALLAKTLPAVALPHIRQAVEVVAMKLRVHFENEEDLVFPLATELLGDDELRQVVAEMAAIEPTTMVP